MRLGVPREVTTGERRVALVPEEIEKLAKAGHELVVQSGAGIEALISDEDLKLAGAQIVAGHQEIWQTDLIVKVAPPSKEEVSYLKPSSTLIGFLNPLSNPALMRALAATGATAFAMEAIPRISRAQPMDALSSQATVAGYRSVTLAANLTERFYPLLMTAAGTIPPARVLVLGAGVAGLQAIATAKRLGALVSGYDVRSSVKEQIESLGGKFLELNDNSAEGEGGYARALTEDEKAEQQKLLGEKIAGFDIVISTALVPGLPAPRLITADAVGSMRPGSVIVDLAGEAGGNCELTQPGETIVTKNQVTIAAPLNLPSSMPRQASQLYARNIHSFLNNMTAEDKSLHLNFEDEIVVGSCIVRGGEIVNTRAREIAEKE